MTRLTSGTSESDEKIALVKAKIDEAQARMRAELEERLFRTDAFYANLPRPKPTPRWKRAYWRVRGYLVTLWWALRGDDLEHAHDYDGY